MPPRTRIRRTGGFLGGCDLGTRSQCLVAVTAIQRAIKRRIKGTRSRVYLGDAGQVLRLAPAMVKPVVGESGRSYAMLASNALPIAVASKVDDTPKSGNVASQLAWPPRYWYSTNSDSGPSSRYPRYPPMPVARPNFTLSTTPPPANEAPPSVVCEVPHATPARRSMPANAPLS